MMIATRLVRNIALTVLLGVVLFLGNRLYGLSLRDTSFYSGWLLIGGVGLLVLYNIRKKFPFLPLFDVSTWLQVHIYTGWLVIALFLLHTSFRLPNGILEITLWLLFAIVAVSGAVGLILSRMLPNRIRRHDENIIFERIPIFRAQLKADIEGLAMRSVTETSSNTITQYYLTQLQPYFAGPRNFFAHLVGSNRVKIEMTRKIKSLERYLNIEGKEILGEIEWRVMAKNDLDRQYALQWLLKGWLFVHIPLTYSLILIAVVHAVLVYSFSGGTP